MTDADTFESAIQRGENEIVVAYELLDLDDERCMNTFFSREKAEEKKENLIEAWPEHTEDSLDIVEVLVNVR